MLRVESGETKLADKEKILEQIANTHIAVEDGLEDDFHFFCMTDDLFGLSSAVSVPELPSIADSCYVERAKVFLPPRKL